MLAANRQRLEKYRQKYNDLVNHQFLNMEPGERAEVIDVIRKEFIPGYTVMEWCGHCVADMLKLAFREMDSRPEIKTNDIHTPNRSNRPKGNNR